MHDSEMSQEEMEAAGFGTVSWWDLRDTVISPDALRGKFTAAGLDPDEVPDIRATTAIARAAREFKMGRKGKDQKRYRAEVVYKDPTRIEVQIQYHTKDENRRTSWLPHEKIAWDVSTNRWDMTGVSAEAKEFRDLALKRMSFYDHVWIRSWLKERMVSLDGFAVGPNFYTPMSRCDETKKVGELVLSIGSSEFYSLDVMEGDQTFRSVSKGARDDIEMSLDRMISKIADWDKSSRKIREDSAVQTIADFVALKARADLYADSLRVSLDDLKKSIGAAQERAKDLIDGVVTPTPVPDLAGALEATLAAAEDEVEAEENGVPIMNPMVPVTVSEDVSLRQYQKDAVVDALRAKFKAHTGKEAPEITDIEALRGLVQMVLGEAF